MDILFIIEIALVVTLIIALIVALIVKLVHPDITIDITDFIEPGNKRAGRHGEAVAVKAIKSVLRDGDRLFTNVEITFEDKPTELDNVIVNSFGVFIIEVKNYNGKLVGNEDDYEWLKYKTTDAGNTYERAVKNPIKQVKRQVYILAKYLDYYGSRVWIEGYALLIHGNSPVKSTMILSSVDDIDRAIHTPGRHRLTKNEQESIVKLLQ